jgi:hypothetical protein
MEPVVAGGLVLSEVHVEAPLVRDHLAPGQEVFVRLALLLDEQPAEVVPESGVRDREVADPPALREDRQPLSVVVEVLELDGPQGALAEAVVEQESERDLVAKLGTRDENRSAVVRSERRAQYSPRLRSLDDKRGVALEIAPPDMEEEEVTKDAEVLVVRPWRSRSRRR